MINWLFVFCGNWEIGLPSPVCNKISWRWSGEYCYMTLLTRHKTKDSPYFQIKIIILTALRGVKFPEGGAAAPVAPPWIRPCNHLMSTWLFSPSLLSANAASWVVLDVILVLSRAIIADWLSQFKTTFLFLISANIRWDASLPTARLQLETKSHCCQGEWLLRLCHYDCC